ncbi:MAG: hypothetical protein J4215_00410 [Candidatus Diapherotrites archaeon]|uniref:Uncharacterized protein n=1 Tax=Candidatus Iainarchaeum sp. TaxID=3101447 RepID=A0A8T4LDQ7_9ARCH|nr:hypothetical protein [Candidatus Diapherotrites archaeon]
MTGLRLWIAWLIDLVSWWNTNTPWFPTIEVLMACVTTRVIACTHTSKSEY